MLPLLDIVLTFTHLIVIAFNVFGWIWPRTRAAHFWVVMATAFSWLVLGIWYGFGYCVITDWQWQVKEQLGETGLPSSFIKYFADHISGTNISSSLIDVITAAVFAAVFFLAIYLRFSKTKNR